MSQKTYIMSAKNTLTYLNFVFRQSYGRDIANRSCLFCQNVMYHRLWIYNLKWILSYYSFKTLKI